MRPDRPNASLAPVPVVLSRLLPESLPAGSGLQIGVDQVIQLDAIAVVTGVEVTCVGLVLRTDGTLQELRVVLAIPSSDIVATVRLACPEGWLLWLSLSQTAGVPGRGICYARALLTSIVSTGGVSGLSLLAGYVSFLSTLSWPGGVSEPSVGVDVKPRLIQVTDPLVGADWAFVLAGMNYRRLWGITGTLTTSAAVPGRFVSFRITLGGFLIAESFATVVQAAGLVRTYVTCNVGFTLAAASTRVYIAFPVLPVANSATIEAVTSGIDVGDQWTNVRFYVEQNEDV